MAEFLVLWVAMLWVSWDWLGMLADGCGCVGGCGLFCWGCCVAFVWWFGGLMVLRLGFGCSVLGLGLGWCCRSFGWVCGFWLDG